jgi:hypothetical protein
VREGPHMMLHRSKTVLLALAAVSGAACASALPPVPANPTPIAVPATGPRPRPASVAIKRDLGDADGVARLCEALRDEDGIEFDGNEVERARSREEHEQRRAAAAEATYAVRIPAGGFAFRSYDLDGRSLALDTGRNFVVGDGAELVASDPKAPLAFSLPPDAAERALKSQAAGELALNLVFRPVRSELRRDGCVRLSGGRVVKVPVEVLAYTLLTRAGAPVARGQTPDFVDDAPVTAPAVSVGRPRSSEGQEVSEAVATAARGLGPTLLPCYEKALQSRPNLRGTLVLDVRVLADGRLDSPRMQVSSLGDETLVACAVSRTAHAKLSGVSTATRLSLPVSFGAKGEL